MLLLWTPNAVLACPKIGDLIDYNCDQHLKIVFTGDSIVRGTRDTRTTRKGYPGRIADHLDFANIVNLGVPGNSTLQLYNGFKRYLTPKSVGKTYRSTRSSDYLFLAIGTNDWRTARPDLTVRNIVRIVAYLNDILKKLDGYAPMIVVATITPNLREFESAFARKVNTLLLAAKRRGQLPVYVRTDDMPVRLLDDDGLHPDPHGYDFLASRFQSFIFGTEQLLCERNRPDRDMDGIYDAFETAKFGTNRNLTDTDGDGISDGEEVFTLFTDPLVPN